MSEFIYDMIHLTEGEKLLKYWWIWLLMLLIATGYIIYTKRK